MVTLRGGAEVLPLQVVVSHNALSCRWSVQFKTVHFMLCEFNLRFSKAADEVWDDWKPWKVHYPVADVVQAVGWRGQGRGAAARGTQGAA